MEPTPSPPGQLLADLQATIPGASLVATPLPQCPAITLWLLDPGFPQWQLEQEQAQRIMASPPFWSFCWASGQVLATHILRYPALVKEKRVVDFGAGSGVVAIACKLAGAHEVIAVDSDPQALAACAANAGLNGASIRLASSLEQAGVADIVTVADVFYDRDNLPLLEQLIRDFPGVWVADSRLRGQPLQGLEIIHRASSFTVPDLDESSEFNHVSLYNSAGQFEAGEP